ncbi:MAG: hypothetical protein ACRENJ_04195 [Candidatus Eiseniibacteriota bacterium]
MLEWVRESRHGSWLISTAAYLIAIGGALYLRRSAGESGPVELVGALLMAVALIVTALVMRSPVYPRWSLITAAGVLGAGMIGPLLIVPAPGGLELADRHVGLWLALPDAAGNHARRWPALVPLPVGHGRRRRGACADRVDRARRPVTRIAIGRRRVKPGGTLTVLLPLHPV